MANYTYQGLTTCQAMKAQNSIGIMDLKAGDKLQAPLRCAFPTLDQTKAGAKFLLTYITSWGDSITSIAETFGIGVAAGFLLLFGLSRLLFCFYSRPSHKDEQEAAARPEPQPLSDSIDHSDKSWNFSESNIIKGSVYRGQFQGDDAAVKVMKGDVSVEMNLLKKINHNRQAFRCQTSITLSWKQRVQIAYNVEDAVNYLRNYINPTYMHKNLKTSNILLDGNFRAKVSNFGLARAVENDGGLQLARHVVGTQGYMAPKYIENGAITPKLDVFAFRVVLLELLSGRKTAEVNVEGLELLSASIKGVLEGVNVRERLQNFIDRTLRAEYPLGLALSMVQLARNCVADDLNARPSMAEVLIAVTKILSSLDWCPSIEFQSQSSPSRPPTRILIYYYELYRIRL
ncbi:hypothetical protein CRYUN_Cryun09bG0218500 [Craigia yunnanensis]